MAGKKEGGREEETQRMHRYRLARGDGTGLLRVKIRAVVRWRRATGPVPNEKDEGRDVEKLQLAVGG